MFDTFLNLLEPERLRQLAIAQAALDDTLREGEDAIALRAQWRALKGLAASIVPPPDNATEAEARAALVAQWPAAFLPLPLWFADPTAAAAADPPGPPCVVDCGGGGEPPAPQP